MTDIPFAMPDSVTIALSEPPLSVNNLYANLKKGGRILTDEAKAWRTAAGYQLNTQHPPHVPGPVSLEIAVADKGNGDLDNKAKCLIDLLVGHGVIEADNRRIVRDIHLFWDAEITGCRVRIKPAYDKNKDLAGCIKEGFAVVRDRMKAGGKPWNPK